MPSTCASLSLSGVDFGEFGGARVPADGVTETTVGAEAAQGRASVSIDPPDTDQSAAGHQVALGDVPEVSRSPSPHRTAAALAATVCSSANRKRQHLAQEEAAAPAPECLRGAGAAGFSLVVYEGGSIEDLGACVESRNVTADQDGAL